MICEFFFGRVEWKLFAYSSILWPGLAVMFQKHICFPSFWINNLYCEVKTELKTPQLTRFLQTSSNKLAPRLVF
uniref:Uncharacterized protein n=1 Tax=Setaria italica TaxID=4555 RepID=K3ZBF9_SETIT